MRATKLKALVVVVAALGVAACGDSDSDPPPPPPPPPETRLWAVPDGADPLSTEHRSEFLAGNVYVNAHTSANPGGEIRGQLDEAGTAKIAILNGAQETPAVTTGAFGAGVLTVNETTGAIRGFVVTSGLTGATAAHVHPGGRGVSNPFIVPLAGGPDVWVVPDDAVSLTAEQITLFQNGELYFNVHTTANPGGEIRGQIDKEGTVKLASMNGAQETPAVTTAAFGAGVLVVEEAIGDERGEVSGFIYTSGLVAPTAAHVHPGARGVAAGPIVDMIGGPRLWVIPDEAGVLTEEQIASFGEGNLYFNAHTAANPGGEIRGQIDRLGAVRVAALDGAQEAPPVTTDAFGAGIFAVDGDTGRPSGFAVTRGLVSPTAAHLHPAARGATAPPLVPLLGP